MKLRRIEIHNFRGFAQPVGVDVEDFTGLIGKNDIGKSTILSALTIFLEGEGAKMEPDDGCLQGNKSNVTITCEFDELPAEVVLDDQFKTTLADESLLAASGRIRIKKVYDCTKSKIGAPEIIICAENHPVDSDGKSLLPLTIADLKKKAEKVGVELETGEAPIKAKLRRAIVERSASITRKAVDVSIGKNDSETLWKQLLKHLPMCALFVSDRASSDKDKEAQTPMGVAVEAALGEVQAELDKLEKHVETRVQDVANRTLAKLTEMNPELASELKAELRDTPKWKDLFKYSLNSNAGVPMDKRGSGVRRLVLLNFFRAEAERKANSEGGRPVIYAIEEPETSQHPDHQRMLVRALGEIASKGGQVIVTTHAPGLAGEMPTDGLRFLDEVGGKRVVRSSSNEDPNAFFTAIAERLGMLPDNQVKVLICVEGLNDIRFLSNVSRTLHAHDESLPDLSRDPRFVFMPLNGGNLQDIVNAHLFKHLRKPEFHLYDSDGKGTYAAQIAAVRSRGDKSRAEETKKRYIECYIHPDAILRHTGVTVAVDDVTDYTSIFGNQMMLKKKAAKAVLCNEVAKVMTVAEIDARDGTGEVREWLKILGGMAANS